MKKLNLKKYKGFTLIEMMVVVLIIGILAAIALPQYRNAVRKARVAEAKITLRALIDATDRYFLATQERPSSFDDLDISVQTDTQDWTFEYDDYDCGENGLCGCILRAYSKRENDYYLEFASVNYNGGGYDFSGKLICCGENNNGINICTKLDGTAMADVDNCFFL